MSEEKDRQKVIAEKYSKRSIEKTPPEVICAVAKLLKTDDGAQKITLQNVLKDCFYSVIWCYTIRLKMLICKSSNFNRQPMPDCGEAGIKEIAERCGVAEEFVSLAIRRFISEETEIPHIGRIEIDEDDAPSRVWLVPDKMAIMRLAADLEP